MSATISQYVLKVHSRPELARQAAGDLCGDG
jgi:hypothetical protein